MSEELQNMLKRADQADLDKEMTGEELANLRARVQTLESALREAYRAAHDANIWDQHGVIAIIEIALATSGSET